MLRFSAKDFGPIVEGSVDLKPLTIFVGPNNVGKSYMAMLIYAFSHSIAGPRWRYASRSMLMSRVWRRPVPSDVSDVWESFGEWHKEGGSARKSTLPEKVRSFVGEVITEYMQGLVEHLGLELQRCYGSPLKDLVNRSRGSKTSSVRLQDTPTLAIGVSLSNGKLLAEELKFDVSKVPIDVRMLLRFYERSAPPQPRRDELLTYLALEVWQSYAMNFPAAFYLPAARSGILQGHKALAGFMVSRSPLAGIEPMEVPRLTGAVADFLSNILTLEKRKKTGLHDVGEFLEREVVGGSVSMRASKLEYPEIYYKPETGEFPLHRTSSMVSELAPLVLFLKHLIQPRGLLIIEEPESHLHPQGQRKMAQAIAKLLRARVNILITTHSDYLIDQINNLIRRSQLPQEERADQVYSAEDYIEPEEVGAYLFELDPETHGSVIRELQVTSEEAIPEEEFARVTEALYEETVKLQRRL